MIEVREVTEGVAADVTRQSLRTQTGVRQLPTDWSCASNTASSYDDEFRVWEALSDEAFDSWEESLKKRQ